MNRIKMSTNRKLLILGSSLLALLLLCSVALLIVSCSKPSKEYNTADGEAKLIVISVGNVGGQRYFIVYDSETKVEYILTDRGITPRFAVYGQYKYYEEKPND